MSHKPIRTSWRDNKGASQLISHDLPKAKSAISKLKTIQIFPFFFLKKKKGKNQKNNTLLVENECDLKSSDSRLVSNHCLLSTDCLPVVFIFNSPSIKTKELKGLLQAKSHCLSTIKNLFTEMEMVNLSFNGKNPLRIHCN